MLKTCILTILLISFIAISVSADPVEVSVSGDQLLARIGVGTYNLNLTITFENVIGLSPQALSITPVNVVPNDLNLLQRFVDPRISIPAQLPLLVSIRPPQGSALTFTGVYDLEISTTNLSFDPGFRLFKAPEGGFFEDVTNFSGVGSYRVRGTSGDFSDFLILLDLRPQNQAVLRKFDQLQQTLNSNISRIAPAMFQTLQGNLDGARSAWHSGQTATAVSLVQDIATIVKADNGQSMPNTYRANDSNAINVAGTIRAQAATLVFSLNL